MKLRPATPNDAEAAAAIVIAGDVADLGEADYSLEDLHDEWRGLDLALDAAIAIDGAGTPIGCAHFRGTDVLAVVHPDREGEGAGSALLEWAVARGAERGADTLRQAVAGQSSRALLEAAGWERVRSYWRMERAVNAADAAPSGLRALRVQDGPALYAIHEAAFSRNADYRPQSEAEWTAREIPAADRDLSRVADPAGFALARRWEDGVVYVPLLAVHPDAWGQGIGSALLRGVFAAAATAGMRHVQLNVASDNPNAIGLYERVGMRERWRVDAFEHRMMRD